MRSCLIGAAAIFALLLAGATEVAAQGKGHGLGKAMSAASKGSSASGLNKASQSLSKGKYGKSNAGLNRAAKSLNRIGQTSAPPLGGAAGEGSELPLSNKERNLDHRLQQSDHLREISERNGNERLLDTADRMEASAIRNYERQTGQVYQPPVPVDPNTGLPISDPTLPSEPLPSEDAPTPSALESAKPAPQSRSSWLPAWLRWGK